MVRLVLVLALAVIYILCGSFIEAAELIVDPANWSTYGALWGMLFVFVTFKVDVC